MNLYRTLLRPLFFQLDPERAHNMAMSAITHAPGHLLQALAPQHVAPRKIEQFGLTFPNPVGLAAGMDKNADCPHAWEHLGFGFAELGTITKHAQPGNPKPRAFRYPSREALINRMGFNNNGADACAAHLSKLRDKRGWPSIPIGMNIGKSRVTPLEEAAGDYHYCARILREFASYFAINISSPNTPGLRDLHNLDHLSSIAEAVMSEAGGKPVLVKIAPDLEDADIEPFAERAKQLGLAGIIATNTSLSRDTLPEGKDETGGMSGRPLSERATRVIQLLRQATDLPLVASGGVMDAASALEKKAAGADLVQIYTGFVYSGPALAAEIAAAWKN